MTPSSIYYNPFTCSASHCHCQAVGIFDAFKLEAPNKIVTVTYVMDVFHAQVNGADRCELQQ